MSVFMARIPGAGPEPCPPRFPRVRTRLPPGVAASAAPGSRPCLHCVSCTLSEGGHLIPSPPWSGEEKPIFSCQHVCPPDLPSPAVGLSLAGHGPHREDRKRSPHPPPPQPGDLWSLSPVARERVFKKTHRHVIKISVLGFGEGAGRLPPLLSGNTDLRHLKVARG